MAEPASDAPSPEAMEYIRQNIRRAIFQMVRERSEFDQKVCQLAWAAGEDPLLFDEPDGTIRIEFAGFVLGHVMVSSS